MDYCSAALSIHFSYSAISKSVFAVNGFTPESTEAGNESLNCPINPRDPSPYSFNYPKAAPNPQ